MNSTRIPVGRSAGEDHPAGVSATASAGTFPTLAGLLREADRLMWAGASREAIDLLERARTMGGSAVERYAVGASLLRASQGRLGWDLYDLHPSRPVDRLPGVQRWDGQPCRLLIVMAEQGFGDAIQFLRFVPQVVTLAETVVVAIHDELLDVTASSPLLRTCTVMAKSTARRTTWPTDARWERLMSIPAKVDKLRAGAMGPYLQVGRDTRPLLPASPTDTVTVGVAWRSTPRGGVPNRSVPARLLPHLTEPGRVRLVALHRNRDIRAAPDGVEIVRIDNLLDTTRVIARCDYVVTVDTLTAHLAPAIGVPTFVCLRHRADWRWGTPANRTRWYRAAELLFQDESQQWRPVLRAAARQISENARGVIDHPPPPTVLGSDKDVGT